MKRTPITPVVLAAGDSVRMGYPKALLPIGADTFLTRILATLEDAKLADSVVVLGTQAARIEPQLSGRTARVVINPNPAEGQLSSVRIALGEVDPSSEGCLIWPVDQPAISVGLVRSLVRLFTTSGALLALPLCREMRGHPAIFRRTLFPAIMNLPPGERLKTLVLERRQDTALLPTEEVATIEDVDTPADYLKFMGETLEAALSRSGLNREPAGSAGSP